MQAVQGTQRGRQEGGKVSQSMASAAAIGLTGSCQRAYEGEVRADKDDSEMAISESTNWCKIRKTPVLRVGVMQMIVPTMQIHKHYHCLSHCRKLWRFKLE